MKNRFIPTSFVSTAYIFFICLVCNWMLLVNDGFFWDDNVYYGLIQGKHYEEFSLFILETGLPINILFFRLLDVLVGITNHRWISFVTIFFSALLLNDLIKHYAIQFKSIPLIFTTFYLTLFPFKSTVLLCTTVYQVMMLFFIMAVYIRVNFGIHDSMRVRIFALLAFSALSFISFNTASILVLFYFYLAFEYFYSKGFRRTAFAPSNIWIYTWKNIFVLLLPLVYWAIKNIYFPTHGLYTNYNKINFDFGHSFSAGLSFASTLFKYGPLYNIANKSQFLFGLIVLLFLLLILFPAKTSSTLYNFPIIKKDKRIMIFWAIGFLVISALPYSLVQIGGRPQGWESRHAILFTLSFPIFVLILIIVWLNRIRVVGRMKSIDFIFRPFVVCVALSGVISSNMVYLDYQALAIKQWSVVENLKQRPELKKYSSFWIEDLVGDFSKKEFTWYEANHQSWYEWVAIFTRAWGAEKWYGNNFDESSASYYKGVRYSASEINPGGPECNIVLLNTASFGKYAVIWNYWMAKYFGTEEGLRRYLLAISSIKACDDK